jgi:Icc-related predicted phosphoesterase
MKLLHLSDWHADADMFKKAFNREIREDPRMLDADVIVLSGDMVFNSYACFKQPSLEGTYQQPAFQEMLDYLDVVMPGVDVVGVRGNHDYFNYGIQGDSWQGVNSFNLLGYKWASMRGVPLHTGSWNDELTEDELNVLCQQVPLDTEILVTHAPPYGILDDARGVPTDPMAWGNAGHDNIGSHAFRKLVESLPTLKLHMFGHVHEQGANVQVRENVIFSNASTTANFIVLPLAS